MGLTYQDLIKTMMGFSLQCIECCSFCLAIYPIDPSHKKSHNASDKLPTMHHFVTEMCTFLLQNGAFWNM